MEFTALPKSDSAEHTLLAYSFGDASLPPALAGTAAPMRAVTARAPMIDMRFMVGSFRRILVILTQAGSTSR